MAQALEAIFYRGDDQNRTDHTPTSGAVSNGVIVDLGTIIGVCTSVEGIGNNTLGSLATEGVFKIAKDSGVVFSKSDPVFFNTSTRVAKTVGGANTIRIGIADEAAASGHNNVKCDINRLGPQDSNVATDPTTTTTT